MKIVHIILLFGFVWESTCEDARVVQVRQTNPGDNEPNFVTRKCIL